MPKVECVFPASCARCGCREGMPSKVETAPNGNVCLIVRCRQCRCEWEIVLSGGRVALAPKRDRRHSQKEKYR